MHNNVLFIYEDCWHTQTLLHHQHPVVCVSEGEGADGEGQESYYV